MTDCQQPEVSAEIAFLLERISSAFAGVPRPSITRSVAAALDDDWVFPQERARELAALDTEQVWTEVSDDAIERFQTYFTFSDADGWRFYLPAHMSYYLRRFPNPLYDAVYWACTSPDPKFELLSPEQRSCVSDFLTLIHEHVVPVHYRHA